MIVAWNEKRTMSIYVKIPRIKTIIDDPNTECEKKLNDIRVLVEGGKPKPVEPIESSPGTSGLNLVPPASETATVPVTAENFSLVLDEIPGAVEKKNAESLLHEIERSNIIQWSPETLEIIIDGSPVKYTNIKHLIKRVVTSFPASLPLGLTLFLEALLRIKASISLIKNGDSKELMANIIKIKSHSSDDTVRNTSTLDDVPQKDDGEPALDVNEERKRGRESDGDDGDDNDVSAAPSKRLRGDAVRRDFDLPTTKLDRIRRSPRLKKEISDAWKHVSTRKKRPKNP